MPMNSLLPSELIGTADFPSIFLQDPREGMHLHWDGNNTSLAERNLSAALGAGVTPEFVVDHAAIDRVADWLKNLQPPPSPYRVDAAAVARGRDTYMRYGCVACHGYQDVQGYVFKGEKLGQVELNYDPKVGPTKQLGVDPRRLDSYTERLRDYQVAELFKGTNISSSRLRRLSAMPTSRLTGYGCALPICITAPSRRWRICWSHRKNGRQISAAESTTLDPVRGGFVAPPCDSPPAQQMKNFCYDTSLPGNNNTGHRYGNNLSPAEKSDLLAYLLTF